MAAVLLGMAGLDALDRNAESQPPDGELGEPLPGPCDDNSLTCQRVRERYGVSLWVVHYWIERGIVPAVQRKRNAPYAITIDNELDQRLREWAVNSTKACSASARVRQVTTQSSAHRVSLYPCRLISLSKGVSRILLSSGETTP